MIQECPTCGAPLLAGLCAKCGLRQVFAAGDAIPVADEPFSVGPYRTIRLLGSGGMGAVYLSEQTDPVRRQVALKITKPGMDSAEIIRRFEAERQALALMDHPHIAREFDAGTTADGRPYFAMEYVDGLPITRYCDQHQLSTEARLRLFGDVCRALHHAHMKGVIHRDIKPSNVLVTERDGRPWPMVIDFGLAKAVDPLREGQTVFTRQGQLLGTPEYMSPEQALGTGDIDTATDVYSLGILLYKLLTGVLPFDSRSLRERGYLEILRVIREDDPPKPATRLRALGDTASSMASRRDTSAAALIRRIQGDLEWITMRAIEKERTRRYPSAAALAEDIDRHLNHEPVSAGPPGQWYQASKFVRKHRALTLAVAGVFAALALGLVLTARQYARAEEQRGLAEANAKRADGQAAEAARALVAADQSRRAAEESRVLAERGRKEADRMRAEAESISAELGRQLYAADMVRAGRAADEGNTSLVSDLLERHWPRLGQPDLRGFEWFMWWRLANTSLFRMSKTGPALAFSPDSRLLATAGGAGGLGGQLFDLALGQTIARFPDAQVDSVAFDPKGRLLALRGPEGIRLVDVDTLRTHQTIPWTGARYVAFSPTKSLVASGVGKQVRIWDYEKGEAGPTLPIEGLRAGHVVYSPDGTLLAAGVEEGPVHVWKTATNERWPLIADWRPRRSSFAVAFSPDGKLLAVGDDSSQVQIWQVSSRTKRETMQLSHGVLDVAFSPRGDQLAVAVYSKAAEIFYVPGGAPLGSLPGHSQTPDMVAYSPDGRFIATGARDQTIRVWDANKTGFQGFRTGLSCTCLAYSRDGSLLAVGGLVRGVAEIRVFRASSNDLVVRLPGTSQECAYMGFSPDGSRLAMAERGGTIRTFAIPLGKPLLVKPIRQINRQNDLPFAYVSYTPDGRFLVTPDEKMRVAFRHADSGEIAHTVSDGQPSNRAVLSADGSLMAVMGQSSLTLWELPARRRRFEKLMPDPLPVAAFSNDSRLVATLSRDLVIRVWDTATGGLVRSLRGLTGFPFSMEFSADGKRLVAPGATPDVRVWEIATGTEVLHLKTLGNARTAVFSPDGQTLAVGTVPGFVHLFHAADPAAVATRGPRLRLPR